MCTAVEPFSFLCTDARCALPGLRTPTRTNTVYLSGVWVWRVWRVQWRGLSPSPACTVWGARLVIRRGGDGYGSSRYLGSIALMTQGRAPTCGAAAPSSHSSLRAQRPAAAAAPAAPGRCQHTRQSPQRAAPPAPPSTAAAISRRSSARAVELPSGRAWHGQTSSSGHSSSWKRSWSGLEVEG